MTASRPRVPDPPVPETTECPSTPGTTTSGDTAPSTPEAPLRVNGEPLRIAHVVYSFDYGGLERRILRLIEGLTPLGAEFKVISLRPSAGQFLPAHPAVEHIVLGAKPGVDWRAIRRLTALLRESRVHIVHSHNWVSMLEGIVAGRLAKVPVVVHGEHGASRFEPENIKPRRTLTQRCLARAADAIVPVNESIRDRLVALWRLPAERCTVIRNGVDTERFRPAERAPGNPLVVGSLSRLERIKNFPCLIRAVHRLNAGAPSPRVKLVIVGDGAERPALEALTDELGARAYVELPGSTDSPQGWYRQFDIYVNCSFSEGMSNTVLEAMACGLPVVATDCAGNRDWLAEGENALFFENDRHEDLARRIEAIASDAQVRRAMAGANRLQVTQKFAQKGFIDAYRNLYIRLLIRNKALASM